MWHCTRCLSMLNLQNDRCWLRNRLIHYDKEELKGYIYNGAKGWGRHQESYRGQTQKTTWWKKVSSERTNTRFKNPGCFSHCSLPSFWNGTERRWWTFSGGLHRRRRFICDPSTYSVEKLKKSICTDPVAQGDSWLWQLPDPSQPQTVPEAIMHIRGHCWNQCILHHWALGHLASSQSGSSKRHRFKYHAVYTPSMDRNTRYK